MSAYDYDALDPAAPVRIDGNGVAWYRASSIMADELMLVAARAGYDLMPWPEQFQQIFKEGDLHEQSVLDALVEDYGPVSQQQAEVEMLVGGRVGIVGHIDGMYDTTLAEVKAFGKDTWDEAKRLVDNGGPAAFFERYPGYAGQFTVYWHGMEAESGVYAIKNRNNGKLLVFEVDAPPMDLTAIKVRLAKIDMLGRKGDLKKATCTGGYPCRVRYLGLCADQKKDDQPEITTDDELQSLIEQYDELRTEETLLKAKKDLIRDRIRIGMKGQDAIRLRDWSVKVVVQMRPTLDMDKLRATVDLQPYYHDKPVEQLRVTKVGE